MEVLTAASTISDENLLTQEARIGGSATLVGAAASRTSREGMARVILVVPQEVTEPAGRMEGLWLPVAVPPDFTTLDEFVGLLREQFLDGAQTSTATLELFDNLDFDVCHFKQAKGRTALQGSSPLTFGTAPQALLSVEMMKGLATKKTNEVHIIVGAVKEMFPKRPCALVATTLGASAEQVARGQISSQNGHRVSERTMTPKALAVAEMHSRITNLLNQQTLVCPARGCAPGGCLVGADHLRQPNQICHIPLHCATIDIWAEYLVDAGHTPETTNLYAPRPPTLKWFCTEAVRGVHPSWDKMGARLMPVCGLFK